MANPYNVVVIVGSLRKESFTLKIANALARLAPDSVKLNVTTLHDISFFNQDLEATPPADWVAFREKLQKSNGILFVTPMEEAYEGQVVGEHCRDNDLPVNICREKKLTNVRSSTAEAKVNIKAPRQMTMELALEYIEDDEYVEITPTAVRVRKSLLKENDRKKWERSNRGAGA